MTWAIDEKGYSQRRACALIGIAPKPYRYVTSRHMTVSSASGCIALSPIAAGSAIGACTFCYAGKASR